MVDQRVPRYVYITEKELASLIARSPEGGNYVDARFGANRVWLEDVPANQWAFKLLIQWRGIDLSFDY